MNGTVLFPVPVIETFALEKRALLFAQISADRGFAHRKVSEPKTRPLLT